MHSLMIVPALRRPADDRNWQATPPSAYWASLARALLRNLTVACAGMQTHSGHAADHAYRTGVDRCCPNTAGCATPRAVRGALGRRLPRLVGSGR